MDGISPENEILHFCQKCSCTPRHEKVENHWLPTVLMSSSSYITFGILINLQQWGRLRPAMILVAFWSFWFCNDFIFQYTLHQLQGMGSESWPYHVEHKGLRNCCWNFTDCFLVSFWKPFILIPLCVLIFFLNASGSQLRFCYLALILSLYLWFWFTQ